MRDANMIVFSDLDGTLLDHDSYDFRPAQPALDALRARGVPLVLVTSKTRPEVMALRTLLGHRGPFAVENGGAMYVPEGQLQDVAGHSGSGASDGLYEFVLGVPYAQIRTTLDALRASGEFSFEGFGDVAVERVAEWTGLSLEDAARARTRACSEPLRFYGDDVSRARFASALARRGLTAVQGGRFLSVQGESDKGSAVRWLLDRVRRERLARGLHGRLTSVALGDSPNDLSMLREVDVPVVIAPKHGRPPLQLEGSRQIRPARPGPAGFRAGIEQVLAQQDS